MNNGISLISILEANPKSSIRARLEYAIKNRLPVSFYYRGPTKDVLAGRRVKVELVASGLTKKGNLAVRGWVQPPSTSKKGFQKHGWRTFLVDRISTGSLIVYEDEQFSSKRPDYKEGDDGSFSVTYVTSDWGAIRQPKIEKPTSKPTTKPVEPQKDELPQPKPKEKPTSVPTQDFKRENEIFSDLEKKVKTVNNEKILTPDDFKMGIDGLYKKRIEDWKRTQLELGLNTTPGEGTRRKFEKESEFDLSQLLKRNNIQVKKDETAIPLQEEISRIKTLIFF
jgi:hypothetical protein